jgi:hypothetical protein
MDDLYGYNESDLDFTADPTTLSPEEAWATASGLEWSEVDTLSDEDSVNMESCEEEMREAWLKAQELEAQDLQDEGEAFFNSLDPRSWVE